MTLNAFKDGVTVINQDNMNQLLALQDFALIYQNGFHIIFKAGGCIKSGIV